MKAKLCLSKLFTVHISLKRYFGTKGHLVPHSQGVLKGERPIENCFSAVSFCPVLPCILFVALGKFVYFFLSSSFSSAKIDEYFPYLLTELVSLIIETML